MTRKREARDAEHASRIALFGQIEAAAERRHGPLALLRLAEAWAWLANPAEAHGGSAVVIEADAGDGDGGDGGGDGD